MTVPKWFRSDSAASRTSQKSDLRRTARLPRRNGAGGTLLEACLTSGPENSHRVPPLDVKVRSFGCLCAGVNERRPSSRVHGWPRADVAGGAHRLASRPISASMGHRPAGSQASDDASARAGGRYRVDVSGRVRSPGPSCSSRQPASTFHHAVSARTTHGRLGSPLDSALGPGLHVFSSPRTGRSWIHSRHEGGTRRGGNAESHNSASSRQQQAYRRSTAWPQAGL
jgi:hypothetical protein